MLVCNVYFRWTVLMVIMACLVGGWYQFHYSDAGTLNLNNYQLQETDVAGYLRMASQRTTVRSLFLYN